MGNIISTRYQHVRLPEASSRCVAEGVTAAHNFEVASYPLLDGKGVGRYVSSSKFNVGGYDWCILFYPDGSAGDYVGYASAFLRCVGLPGMDAVRTEFTLEIVENQGQARGNKDPVTTRHTFAPASQSGQPKFIEKSRLRSLYSRLGKGYFTVRCVLTVIKEPHTDCKVNLSAVPPPELPGLLHGALKDRRDTDVAFDVGCRVFSAHRFILAARSPVLKAELFDSTEEDIRRLEVVDIEPSIFEMLLHYIYTDSLPPCNGGEGGYSAAVMQNLLVAADRYGLERLKMMCEEQLCQRIDVKTVINMLALANRHCCKRLKDACMAFVSLPDVMGTVVMTDEFIQGVLGGLQRKQNESEIMYSGHLILMSMML